MAVCMGALLGSPEFSVYAGDPSMSVDISQPQPFAAPRGAVFFDRRELSLILRLYGPLEPWFDKTWRPGEITPVN